MKKALKTFFILILCLAVAGGTGYLFFVNLTKSSSAFENINSFVKSSSQKELLIDMQQISTYGGDRFNTIIGTYNDMQQSLQCLNACLIDFENSSAEHILCTKLDKLASQISDIKAMVNEYNIKSQNSTFNKYEGSNNIYESFADFVANYADYVLAVNMEVKKYVSSTNVDVKFDVIDVYANVVKNSLQNLKVDETNNFDNLNYMNSHFQLKNGYLVSQNPNGNFASENNKFIEQYKQCNALSFASNLNANLILADVNSTNVELRAGYYLKIILGA